jgi:hypothetical protein
VAAGEHVGFSIDEDKRLIAVAGKNSFPIEIPSGYGAVWSTTYTKQTQFSREMNKAARTAGKLTGYIAVGIVEGIIEGGDDDDCDDTVERHIKQERRAHRRH